MQKKRCKTYIIIPLLSCLLLVWLDQITKYLFYDLKIWNNLCFLNPVLNDWISWWMSMPMWIIIGITIICIFLFVYLLYKNYLSPLGFVLLFAGTLWNLIDRIYLGWVRDFISIWNFPVFNIADVLLTCGVVLICIEEVRNMLKKSTQ